MSIYTKTNYRKIYEQYYGPIPKDDNGRSYEIHHIDGNHDNCDITNLKLVTIEEHYDIHYAQGDWNACLRMTERMQISPEEKSRLGTLQNKKRIAEGRHHFTSSEWQRENQLKRVANGNHPFVGKNAPVHKLVAEGKHNLQGGKIQSAYWKGERAVARTAKMLAEGKHPSQMKEVCPHCKRTFSITMLNRWHGDKCKLAPTNLG